MLTLSSIGVYLGFPNKKRYRVYVSHVSPKALFDTEREARSYLGLAKKLHHLLFKEVEEDPDHVCCTPSKGRRLLDQDLLNGIRCKYCTLKIVIINT